MRTANIQLTTILNSFLTRSKLVYNEVDNCFYSVGSTKNLNKIYVTDSQAIQKKVIEFIKQNSIELDFDLSTNFRQELQNRIKIIDSRTSSIWAFLYFFFNPNSRSVLLKNRENLQILKTSIDEALIGIDTKPNDDLEEDFATSSETVEIDITEEIDKPSVTLPVTPPKPEKPTLVNLPTDQTPTFTTQTPTFTTQTPTFTTPNPTPPQVVQEPQTPDSSTPAISIPNNSFTTPTPPPAPLIGQAILLPGEPPHLTFDRMKFKTKNDFQITNEINAIDNYVNQMTVFLEPLRKKVIEFNTFRDKIVEIEQHYKDSTSTQNIIENDIKLCENNIKLLTMGQEKNQVVVLYYMEDEIPFFPDTVYDFITSDNTPKDNSPTTQPNSKDQSDEGSNNTSVHTSSSETESTTFAASMLDSFELPVQPKQRLLSDLEKAEAAKSAQQALASLFSGIETTPPSPVPGTGVGSASNPTLPDSPTQEKAKGKVQCPGILKISTALTILNEYLVQLKDEYQKNKASLLTQEKQIKENKQEFKELAETKFIGDKKVSELEKTLEIKTKLLSNWVSAKKLREQYLLNPPSSTPPTPELKTSKTTVEKICEAVPEYRILACQKTHLSAYLKTQATSSCAKEFSDTIWKKLFDQPTQAKAKKNEVKQ